MDSVHYLLGLSVIIHKFSVFSDPGVVKEKKVLWKINYYSNIKQSFLKCYSSETFILPKEGSWKNW